MKAVKESSCINRRLEAIVIGKDRSIVNYKYALGCDKLRRKFHIKEYIEIFRIAFNNREMINIVIYERYEIKY